MTELFAKLTAATAAYNAFGNEVDLEQLASCLEALRVMEAAEREYNSAVADKSAEWDALPRDDTRSSAEENADDTDTHGDRLYWLEVAVRSYYL